MVLPATDNIQITHKVKCHAFTDEKGFQLSIDSLFQSSHAAMPEAVMSEETKNTMKQRLGKLILSRNILEYKRH